MNLQERFFGARPVLFGRAPTAGTALVNVSEYVQLVDLGAVFPTAFALDVTSANAADTAAGTGARTLEIVGLDFDGNPLSEIVTLNGNTIVTTSKAFWRVFGAQCLTFGSGRRNAGNIHIVKTGTGGTYTAGVPGTLTSAMVQILALENLGLSGFFTAPRGQQYRLACWRQGSRVQVGKHMIFKAAERIVPAMPPTLVHVFDSPVGVAVPIEEACNVYLNELEDIYFRCLMGAASGVTSFNAALQKV